MAESVEPFDPEQIRSREDFARALTDLREFSGLSVREIAKRAEVPSATAGGYFSGRHLPPTTQPKVLAAVLTACGVVDPAQLEAWREALRRVRRGQAPRASTARVPYLGLATFQPEDAEWFFGRTQLITELVRRVRAIAWGPGDGVLAVVGPSGSGKSSLLRAGLIPAVQAGGFSKSGRFILFSPGVRPSTTLLSELEINAGGDPSDPLLIVVDQFEELFTLCPDEARRAFVTELLRETTPRSGGREATVVLGLRADFYGQAIQIPELLHVLQEAQLLVGPMNTAELRSAILGPALRAGTDVDDDLVELVVDDLEPRGFIDQAHDTGALPLFSHALLATWERARTGRLTIADYRAAGGIRQAVQLTAEKLFGELSEHEQDLARRIFIRLANVDDDAAVTRRRVSSSELLDDENLASRTATGGGMDDVLDRDGVLDRFIAGRLITADADTVQVSHEALLTAWPRLRGWLDADRAGLRLHRQLTHAAQTWQDDGRDPGALLRGGRLFAAMEWAADSAHERDLNRLERAFLEQSRRQEADYLVAQRHTTRRLKQLLTAVTTLAVVAIVLAVFALRTTATADKDRRIARQQRDLALSRQIAIEANRLRLTDPSLAMQLALTGYRTAQTPETRASLLDSTADPTASRLLGQAGPTSTAVSPDGKTLAVGNADGRVRLWSLARQSRAPAAIGSIVADPKGGQLYAVAFSLTGDLLAAAGASGTVSVWNVANPARPSAVGPRLSGPTKEVTTLAFDPGGRTLFAGSADSGVHVWGLAGNAHPTPAPTITASGAAVQAVAASPDGHALAVGTADGTVRLFDLATRGAGPIATIRVGDASDFVYSVAFSPDGHTLAVGAKDKVVSLYDVSKPAAPSAVGAPLTGFTSFVNCVAFSSDGKWLAAGSSDDSIRVWNVATRTSITTLPNSSAVTSVAFSADGARLVSGGVDGTTRLWSLPGPVLKGAKDTVFGLGFSSSGGLLEVGPGLQDGKLALWNLADPEHASMFGKASPPAGLAASAGLDGSGSISPDGLLLASGTADGHVLLWNIRNPLHPSLLGAPLAGPTKLIEATSFSPDSLLLAVGSDDSKVRLWNLSDPKLPVQIADLDAGNEALDVAFNKTGHLLAAASADDTVRLWDISNPAKPRTLPVLRGFTNYAYSVAFSPDGHTLAAGSTDKTARLWNMTDPTHPRPLGAPLTGPTDTVFSVAFSPDANTLAAGSGDNSIWLWNVANLDQPSLSATLTASTGTNLTVAFSPNGRTLAASGSAKVVRLWDVDTGHAAAHVCDLAGDPITKAEWEQYVPGRAYDPPCRSN